MSERDIRDAMISLENGIREAEVLGLDDVTLTHDAAVALRDAATTEDEDREKPE